MVLHHEFERHGIPRIRSDVRRCVDKAYRLRISADNDRVRLCWGTIGRRRMILRSRRLCTLQECVEGLVAVIRRVDAEDHAGLAMRRCVSVRSSLLAVTPDWLCVIDDDFESREVCSRRSRCNKLAA